MKRTTRRKVKQKARKSLKKRKPSKKRKKYVVDTSAVVNKVLTKFLKKGLKGTIIIPKAVMAELENMANKGKKEGFIGLEEIIKLHKKKKINLRFKGKRPNIKQITYAKSGEIDSMIMDMAKKSKAILITADLVQAKSAQAYKIKVLFHKVRKKYTRKKPEKKSFFKRFFKR